MKQYNFDELIPRKGTNCIKHDALNQFFGRDDLMPMWVADMDFRTPDFIMEALRNRCSHEVLGYAYPPDRWDFSYHSCLPSIPQPSPKRAPPIGVQPSQNS